MNTVKYGLVSLETESGQPKVQPNFKYIYIQIDNLKNTPPSFLPKYHINSINLYRVSLRWVNTPQSKKENKNWKDR